MESRKCVTPTLAHLSSNSPWTCVPTGSSLQCPSGQSVSVLHPIMTCQVFMRMCVKTLNMILRFTNRFSSFQYWLMDRVSILSATIFECFLIYLFHTNTINVICLSLCNIILLILSRYPYANLPKVLKIAAKLKLKYCKHFGLLLNIHHRNKNLIK